MLKKEMPPVHPGEILKEMYLLPMNITISDAAANLGVSRKTISQLVNGRMGISVEMALRLSKAFGTTAELWLNLQRGYDLWNAAGKVNLDNINHWKQRAA